MSTRQMRKRLAKVEERVNPEHDGTVTWEEFNRRLWRQDKKKYMEMVSEQKDYLCSSFEAQFEREDAERAMGREAGGPFAGSLRDRTTWPAPCKR